MTNEERISSAKESLAEFLRNNPQSSINIDNGDGLVIEKPWGLSDAKIRLDLPETEFLASLNQIRFDPRLDALIHIDSNQIEFVFAYLQSQDESVALFLNRTFDFFFDGGEFECKFAEPSTRLMQIASHFERITTDVFEQRSVPQIRPFVDAQRLDQLPLSLQKYFEDRVPRNYFVTCKNGLDKVDLEDLARHLNFVSRYYDRQAPTITIKELQAIIRPSNQPIRMIEGDFPKTLVIPKAIDDIVIHLLEVARRSGPRSAFIYYYQVFEYAGFYYIDEKARSALKHALRDPAFICGGDEKISGVFSIFADLSHNDEGRMRKVIEEHCDPQVIWKEVSNDLDFFANNQTFDGGYICPALIAKDTTESTWAVMWMPKTFDLLTKIRNVLVHAREKRESRGILPSPKNDAILGRYLPLIYRIAEQLALKA